MVNPNSESEFWWGFTIIKACKNIPSQQTPLDLSDDFDISPQNANDHL
jgi:hypothetical protein